MKKILNILLLVFLATSTMAQTVEEILVSVEENNNEIKAAKALYEAQSMEVLSENMLGNTSVGYERMMGTKTLPEKSGKITVTQELDFPSIYIMRRKINKEKINKFKYDYEETRRSILLQTKELCLDLLMLNKQNKLINEKLENIGKLKKLYQKRFDAGDIGKIEMNKITMQEISENATLTINNNEINRLIKEISKLNGGKDIPQTIKDSIAIMELPEYSDFLSEAIESDTKLKISLEEYNIAEKEHKVAQNNWLPSIGISYIREMRPAETSNGFEIGLSIPLWNNLRKVKQAKAYKAYSVWQMEKTQNDVKTDISFNYEEASRLWETLKQYDVSLVYENIRLLNKALETRQISMIEYFTEINSLYEIIESHNILETSYSKALARMYKFRL